MQARTLKPSRSSGCSPMMKCAMPKRQRTVDKTIGRAELVIRESEVNKEDQVMKRGDVTELAASIELRSQVVETMKKQLEAIYPKLSFHNVDL